MRASRGRLSSILHGDDEPGAMDSTAGHLNRGSARLAGETATAPEGTLDRQAEHGFERRGPDYVKPTRNDFDALDAEVVGSFVYGGDRPATDLETVASDSRGQPMRN